MSDKRQVNELLEALRQPNRAFGVYKNRSLGDLCREAADEIERLQAALRRLLNDSMYKDHPEASKMAMDALETTPDAPAEK
jgi:hypothetical protein